MARIVLSLCGIVTVLFMVATARVEVLPSLAPFDTPNWAPDEATKRRALLHAYELVGGISDAWGMVDVNHCYRPEGCDQPNRRAVEPLFGRLGSGGQRANALVIAAIGA